MSFDLPKWRKPETYPSIGGVKSSKFEELVDEMRLYLDTVQNYGPPLPHKTGNGWFDKINAGHGTPDELAVFLSALACAVLSGERAKFKVISDLIVLDITPAMLTAGRDVLRSSALELPDDECGSSSEVLLKEIFCAMLIAQAPG